MNIKAIRNIKMPQAKAYEPRVKVSGKVDGYVEAMLDSYNAKLENLASLYDRNIKLAQKDKTVLVNSGMITSKIDLKKLTHANDFYKGIVDNVKANSEAGTKGLDKAFTRLA